MEILKLFGLFVVTALAEILGCYLPYLWLKQDRSAWLLAPASISLALFAIDHYSDLLLQLGPTRASDLVHGLRIGLTDWTGHRAMATLAGDACYALVWEDCSRSDAVQLVRQALEAAKSRRMLKVAADVTLSAGLATLEVPPRNYPPHQLLDAAQRCLSAAQLSGGDTLKSIAF